MTRYKMNRAVLRDGMAKLGFRELVPESNAGHIITCFHYPNHPNFSFQAFYTALSDRGQTSSPPSLSPPPDQVIYPGKVTKADCFRIGNIGDVVPADLTTLLGHIREVLDVQGIPVPVSG